MMNIIIEFCTFYLMFWWLMCIITKDNFAYNKLESFGNWIGHKTILGKFFLGVSECNFCLENHVATILSIVYSYYLYDYHCLIWGFMCASLSSILRK